MFPLYRRFVFLALLNCTFAASADYRWQQPSYLVQAFTQVALRNEYSQQGRVVRRWEKPIRVWLDHKVGDKSLHADLVRMHITHLSSLMQHPISFVSSPEQANLKIVFTQQRDWAEQIGQLFGEKAINVMHGAVCMANFRVNSRYEIESAAIIIPVDQARMHGKLVTCIVEEITQVMGLPNDSEAVYPSIFNDKTPESLLSGLDGLLLKMLYSPELRSGMTERDVKPFLNKLIRNWQNDGTIKTANRDIRSGELYPLLGY
ncbi:DUF2927 domain-containing protein [Neptuniibacter marinus]|uniref:DUF2927 domain-containing protein n=1 Tax=Neptuniibacter marinus TaxID=1806670 RepID=UPI003B5CA08B